MFEPEKESASELEETPSRSCSLLTNRLLSGSCVAPSEPVFSSIEGLRGSDVHAIGEGGKNYEITRWV